MCSTGRILPPQRTIVAAQKFLLGGVGAQWRVPLAPAGCSIGKIRPVARPPPAREQQQARRRRGEAMDGRNGARAVLRSWKPLIETRAARSSLSISAIIIRFLPNRGVIARLGLMRRERFSASRDRRSTPRFYATRKGIARYPGVASAGETQSDFMVNGRLTPLRRLSVAQDVVVHSISKLPRGMVRRYSRRSSSISRLAEPFSDVGTTRSRATLPKRFSVRRPAPILSVQISKSQAKSRCRPRSWRLP